MKNQGAVGGGLTTAKEQKKPQQQPQQQPQATRTEEASIQELVESCLVNDDFTPVLRILFSGTASSGTGASGDVASPPRPNVASASVPPTPTSTPGGPVSPSPAAASASAATANPGSKSITKSASRSHLKPLLGPLLDGRPALELLQSVLRSVADEQAAVVQEICSSHAMEIATCVAELDRMVASVEELREAMAAGGEGLQRMGQALASTARELHGMLSAQRHLAAAVGGLRAVRRLMSRCSQVGVLLGQRRLFQALQLLEQVRTQDLVLALEVLSNNPQAALALAGQGDAAAAAVANSSLDPGSGGGAATAIPPKSQPEVARLRTFLQGLVSDLEAAIEYYAVAEFNNWLVGVRAESRQVGLRAIRKAAIQRQLDDDLAVERRTAAATLMRQWDAAAVAARVVVGARFRRDLAREGAPAPPHGQGSAGAGDGGGGSSGGGGGGAGRLGKSGTRRASAAAGAGGSGSGSSASGGGGSGSGPGSPLDLATLHPGQPLQAIQALLARHRATAAASPLPPTCSLTDYTTGLLQGVDMQGLHRCVHIHRCLGRMPSLRRYYLDQRRLQLTTDLAPPARFLEAYQSYLAQVTGFFVVEDAVRAAAPDLLTADSAVLLWEATAGSLRAVAAQALEEALGGGAPAAIMLLLKDFMLLVCSALGARGYTIAPITELLTASRLRYHDLLTASVALRIGSALAADPLREGMEVAAEQQAAELAGRLGLPASLDGGGAGSPPALPYRAPYTSCLPRILHAVRGFVTDSLAYLQGLLSPWELLPAVVQARDRLITKTVVDALADHTARLLAADAAAQQQQPHTRLPASAADQGQGGSRRAAWHVKEVMRMITNAWCMSIAMQALDEWTVLQVRPLGAMAAAAAAAAASGSTGGAPPAALLPGAAAAVRGGSAAASGGSKAGPAAAGSAAIGAGGGSGLAGDGSAGAVLAALRSVQDAGERGLLRLISGRAEALVAGARSLHWLPQGPLPPGTSPYAEELAVLLKDTFDAAAATLPRLSYLFLCRAVVRSTGNAFMQLMKEGVKAYNMFAVEQLAADVAALDRFLASCPVPHIAGEFAEPRQLCALLMSPKVEDVLIPEVRRQRYPALDLASLVVILERYRELSRVGKEKTGHVSKRTLEGIAKQLRGQMVSGTALSGPRVLEGI